MPTGSGLCSAFWLLATQPSGQPCYSVCPEIDIMENVSPYPRQVIATLHGPIVQSANYQDYQSHVTLPFAVGGGFHTWGLIWSPGKITWTLDGLPYATATPSTLVPTAQWVFDNQPMRIIFDLAVGGWWGGTPSSVGQFPQSMLVKWVRVYK
jgi:beta-glucanase (GH16 family)